MRQSFGPTVRCGPLETTWKYCRNTDRTGSLFALSGTWTAHISGQTFLNGGSPRRACRNPPVHPSELCPGQADPGPHPPAPGRREFLGRPGRTMPRPSGPPPGQPAPNPAPGQPGQPGLAPSHLVTLRPASTGARGTGRMPNGRPAWTVLVRPGRRGSVSGRQAVLVRLV